MIMGILIYIQVNLKFNLLEKNRKNSKFNRYYLVKYFSNVICIINNRLKLVEIIMKYIGRIKKGG